jgi:hypothetical protein
MYCILRYLTRQCFFSIGDLGVRSLSKYSKPEAKVDLRWGKNLLEVYF